MSRALFSIDRTEHKKFQKEKKREAKKFKKQQALKEAVKKKQETVRKSLSTSSNKSPVAKNGVVSSNKSKNTQKRILKKL